MPDADSASTVDPRLRGRERVLAQIEIWRNELVNLARSNRLLHFRDTRASTLGIVADESEVAAIVERLLRGGSWTFFEPADVDENHDDAEDPIPLQLLPGPGELLSDKPDRGALLRTLRNLDRRASQEYMDKGLWILYLAVGMLRWTDPDTHEDVRSPLLLVPVTLERENPREPYKLSRVEEEIVLNPALVLKLQEFGIQLSSPADLEDVDVDRFLDEVAERVRSRGWAVERRLVISHFSFHKEVMYRDLEAHADEIADHPLVQALVLGAEEGSLADFETLDEEALDEEGLPRYGATVLPADGTQRRCIDAAVRGKSFVMDGPPGTGKSQTIANMIAENISAGRTVLFVSEKAAALEVVEKRLRQVGLGDYTIELHSHKATRKEVAHELARALTHHPQGRSGMPGEELAALVRRRDALSQRAAAINEVREPLGRSLNAVLGRIAQLQYFRQPEHPSGVDAQLSAEEFAEIMLAAGRLAGAWGPIERGDDFLWRDLGEIRLDARTQQRVGDEVAEALSALEHLTRVAQDASDTLGLESSTELASFQRLHLLLQHLQARRLVPVSWLTRGELGSVRELFTERRDQVSDCERFGAELTSLVSARFRDIPPHTEAPIVAAVRGLSDSPLGSGAAALTRARATSLAAGARVAIETLLQAQETTSSISSAFALDERSVDPDRAVELAELAALCAVEAKPESNWLTPSGLQRARRARETLEPLVEAVRRCREQLGGIFTDDVLDLDLEGLIMRFESAHRGFGKLRGAYRDDKRAVAEVTRTRKVSRQVLELLPAAREWQAARDELAAAEKRVASHLGSEYYAGEETDFGVLDAALEIADRALILAASPSTTSGLKRQLALGATPDEQLAVHAEWIDTHFVSWRNTAQYTIGEELASSVLAQPLSTAAEALSHVADLLDQVVGALEMVEAVAGRELTAEQAVHALTLRSQLEDSESALRDTLAADQVELGDAYSGLNTDWDDLEGCLEWAEELCELLEWDIDEDVASRLQSTDIPPDDLTDCLTRWKKARATIAANFDARRADEIQADLMTTVDEARELLSELGATVGDIEEWFEYSRERARLEELGVGEPVRFCERERVLRDEVAPLIERAVLERWADDVIEADQERIGPVRRQALEKIVDEFRELDRRVVELAAARVIKAANARRPRVALGPAGVIQREGAKQRRHMPIRTLLETAGPVAQALKPCFMMTPLTVSQFLPPGFRFDVVIFDEASQVRPSDAINCIYRGDQLIVAGDEQQLPPTSFFEVAMGDEGDEYEEDQFDEFESILKHCLGAGGLRQLPLRWHYRSRHEDLILYSNHSFYEGRLISFPSAIQDAPDMGVTLIHVPDGVYRRGTSRDNPREAQVVAQRMMHWAEWNAGHPDREVTVGVVAFSEAQATAIETELDRLRGERPDLEDQFRQDRLDGYFVKNLENVQGDERDILIFSVGYGRDENGKLTMNFGPLNRAGGKRRLNVAITRARRRVEVVSSIRAEDFAGDLSNEGVRHLQRYLDFAARGHPALALEVGNTQLDAESPFEEEVLRVVRSWGFDAVPQVGAAGYRIDIGVRHPSEPGRYAIGIECDGAMYHSSRVARDRDRLRQEVLEGLGWRLHRIWGTAWYRDRRSQEKALRQAIDDAIANRPEAKPKQKRLELPNVPVWVEETYEVVAAEDRPSWAEPYEVARLSPPSQPWLEMHDLAAHADLRRLIQQVVVAEGPVSREIVLRRVREAWGVGRAGARIREAFASAVRMLSRQGHLVTHERDFLMVPGADPSRVRLPTEDEATRRRVDEVPASELRAAIEHTVRDAIRAERDELTQRVARLYGWNRRGRDIERALDKAVTYLLRMKRVKRVGSYFEAESTPTASEGVVDD
jgi:very-short-patch-repair endonuclease